ncbi:MAG: hypothetical protein DRP29_04955 [Thermodesulfobacteriota bacterium]|nr:MAG: hypothetical protein DRP29_04955 [Thermodesulfobacteriota bacterium]
MFCKKRGQVTVYIILGIIIVTAVITLVVVLSDRSETQETSTFQNRVESLKDHMNRCLESSAESAVYELANEKIANYENELEKRIRKKVEACSNLDTYEGLTVEQEGIRSVNVKISEEKTKVFVEMVLPLKIKGEDKESKLSRFSTEVKLLKECCIPVEVDEDCRSLEDGEFKSCGIILKLNKGQKVQYGGKCVAC